MIIFASTRGRAKPVPRLTTQCFSVFLAISLGEFILFQVSLGEIPLRQVPKNLPKSPESFIGESGRVSYEKVSSLFDSHLRNLGETLLGETLLGGLY